MKSKLGEYITTRKKALKVTQDWIAEKLDVSSNAVSKWVKTGKISRDNFFALVALIGKEGAPYLDDVIDGESRRVEEIDPIPALTVPFQSSRDRQINELVTLARSMSDEGLSIALYESKKIAEQYPAQAKQTLGSSQ